MTNVKIAEGWRKLPAKLATAARSYHSSALKILEDIVVAFEGATRETDKARKFWKDMFHTQRCGSGGQTEISGWFPSLFRRGSADGPAYASNYDPHVAKVNYDLIDTGQTFTMLHGVFGSVLGDHGVAVPDFGSVVFETTPI